MIREQFTIYIEAPPETSLAFVEDMKIEPRITRPVLEGALILDAVEGTLDIVCKRAGKERRREIAEAFLDTILEPGTELATRSRRTLNLDKLKRRQTFDLRTDDRVLRVEVIALTLASPDSAAIVSFEARGAVQGSGRSDFYDRAKETFGNYGVMESAGWQVKFAKLRVVFEPERERARAKSVALELRAPDRTNLRDQLELHRHIADTLLYRWGLYADQE